MKDSTDKRVLRPCARIWVVLAGLLGWMAAAPTADAYVFLYSNARWPLGPHEFTLLLGPAGRTLEDGNTSWDQVATDAADLWNAVLTPVRLTASSGAGQPGKADNKNQVFWSPTV